MSLCKDSIKWSDDFSMRLLGTGSVKEKGAVVIDPAFQRALHMLYT